MPTTKGHVTLTLQRAKHAGLHYLVMQKECAFYTHDTILRSWLHDMPSSDSKCIHTLQTAKTSKQLANINFATPSSGPMGFYTQRNLVLRRLHTETACWSLEKPPLCNTASASQWQVPWVSWAHMELSNGCVQSADLEVHLEKRPQLTSSVKTGFQPLLSLSGLCLTSRHENRERGSPQATGSL